MNTTWSHHDISKSDGSIIIPGRSSIFSWTIEINLLPPQKRCGAWQHHGVTFVLHQGAGVMWCGTTYLLYLYWWTSHRSETSLWHIIRQEEILAHKQETGSFLPQWLVPRQSQINVQFTPSINDHWLMFHCCSWHASTSVIHLVSHCWCVSCNFSTRKVNSLTHLTRVSTEIVYSIHNIGLSWYWYSNALQ